MDTPPPDHELDALQDLDRHLNARYREIDAERNRAFREANHDKIIPDELPGLPRNSSPARLYAGLQGDLARAREQSGSVFHGEKAIGQREQKEIGDLLQVFAAFHDQLQEKLQGDIPVAQAVTTQAVEAATLISGSQRTEDEKNKLIDRLIPIAQSYAAFYGGGTVEEISSDTLRQISKAVDTAQGGDRIREELPTGSKARELYESVWEAYTEALEQCSSESHTEMSIGAANRFTTNKQLTIFHTFHQGVATQLEGGIEPLDAVMYAASKARETLKNSSLQGVTRKVFSEFIEQLGVAYLELHANKS